MTLSSTNCAIYINVHAQTLNLEALVLLGCEVEHLVELELQRFSLG